MRPLGHAIARALRVLGVDRDVARAAAVRSWSDAAASVLGSGASETRAIRADGDTLVVVVPSSHWAGEIRLRERDLVAAIATRAPASGIVRIRPTPGASPAR